MDAPVSPGPLQSSGAHVARAPVRWLEALREVPAPGWPVTIGVALVVAVVASGLMYWLQQSRVDDALAAQQRATVAAARTQTQTSGSSATIQGLNDRLATQTERLQAADRQIARLESSANHREAAMTNTQSRLDVSRARVTQLAEARDSAERRLRQAQSARREAVARATALTGAPLAAGRYVTRFEAFGGTQSPPMAVTDLQGSTDWHVVAVSPDADIRVLGKKGLHGVSIARFTDMFNQSTGDISKSSFRISVGGGRITDVTELH